eukprot:1143893-Pelagomonas_calceolata.AAC.17
MQDASFVYEGYRNICFGSENWFHGGAVGPFWVLGGQGSDLGSFGFIILGKKPRKSMSSELGILYTSGINAGVSSLHLRYPPRRSCWKLVDPNKSIGPLAKLAVMQGLFNSHAITFD